MPPKVFRPSVILGRSKQWHVRVEGVERRSWNGDDEPS